MRTFLGIVVLAAVLWLGWSRFAGPPPGFSESNARDPSRPFVVKVHSDSCPTCIDLGPTWARLESQARGVARLVVLDVTDEDRFRDTVRIARHLGIEDFLERHMEETGTIGVLHGATREPVALFHGERDLERYLAALQRARTR